MNKLLLLFFMFPLLVLSQTQIGGIVTDADTGKPLPFATVKTNNNFVTLTNIDGSFTIQSNSNFKEISVSYIGYVTNKITIPKTNHFVKIYLKTSVEKLKEVVIVSKENPAIKIIKKTIKHKPNNNIETALNSFKFKSYNKVLVTANPDSISGKTDSIYKNVKGKLIFDKVDSTNFKFKKEIEKHHLFISEKISEFKFQQGKKIKETVLASRMAGLKNPIYEILAITLQDISFYKEHYTIAGTQYINPIADNALIYYNYKLLDTVKNDLGSSYLINFKPKEDKESIGMEGVLFIDMESFAITKVIAELKGVVHVRATQNYTYITKNKLWFPSEMNLKLQKGESDKSISLFGGTIKFSNTTKKDSLSKSSKNKPEDITYFISKTTNAEIETNVPIKIKNTMPTIAFEDDAANKNEEFWNSFRTDSLTSKDENAYVFLDSVASAENIDEKINKARSILKGFYPTKYININLGKIINLNSYEGLRLGIGGETNNQLSRFFRLESYLAYGISDTDFKYGFGTSFRLNKEKNTWIGTHYTNDLKEAASLNFILKRASFSPINPRNLNVSKFYNYKSFDAFINTDLQPNLEVKFQVSSTDYTPLFNYRYVDATRQLTQYKLSEATLGFQFNPNNEYMNSPVGKLKIATGYPQITLQLSQSFENVLKSDFHFSQINFRLLQKFEPLNVGSTSILFEGGIIFGDAPISHLFNATPNYTYKNPWAKRIKFAGTNSFETMGYNEFISDKFVAIHLKHNFNKFKLGNKFKPQLTLVTRFAIGTIEHAEYHQGMAFKDLNKGFMESGFALNNLFKGFGMSSFYRLGSYQNKEWSDNLSIKLTYKFDLGF